MIIPLVDRPRSEVNFHGLNDDRSIVHDCNNLFKRYMNDQNNEINNGNGRSILKSLRHALLSLFDEIYYRTLLGIRFICSGSA